MLPSATSTRSKISTAHTAFERALGGMIRPSEELKICYRRGTVSRLSNHWHSHSHRQASDPVYHTRCRRLSAPGFRGENLRAAGPVLLQEMEDLVSRLRNDCAEGGHVDAIQLFPNLTLDMCAMLLLAHVSTLTQLHYQPRCCCIRCTIQSNCDR